jgi:hypothetical protein
MYSLRSLENFIHWCQNFDTMKNVSIFTLECLASVSTKF